MATKVTLQEYWDKLNEHDWWYQMSDDSRVYHRGREAQSKLQAIAQTNSEYRKLYSDFSKHKLHQGDNRPPKPERPEA